MDDQKILNTNPVNRALYHQFLLEQVAPELAQGLKQLVAENPLLSYRAVGREYLSQRRECTSRAEVGVRITFPCFPPGMTYEDESGQKIDWGKLGTVILSIVSSSEIYVSVDAMNQMATPLICSSQRLADMILRNIRGEMMFPVRPPNLNVAPNQMQLSR